MDSEVKVPNVTKALQELYIVFIETWLKLIITAFMYCNYINALLCFQYAGSCDTQELLPTREVVNEMS